MNNDSIVIATIVGLIVFLPVAIVLPIGWVIRRVRGTPAGQKASPRHAISSLLFIATVLAMLLIKPWVGFALFVGAGVWSVTQLLRMPPDEKRVFFESIAEHERKPWVRALNVACGAVVLLVLASIVWDMFVT